MKSILYFDTNIHSFISACDEGKELKRYLDSKGFKVKASSTNVFEVYAIPENQKRVAELKTLIEVASLYDGKPESWLHAQEVKKEIARCRPSWLRKIIFDKKINNFLEGHLAVWKKAKSLELPPSHAYGVYRRDFEGGIQNSISFQKSVRKTSLEDKMKELKLLGFDSSQNLISNFNLDLDQPEIFWRVDCLMAWHNALALKATASRDYADWLQPYVKTEAFSDSTYADFWINDVSAKNVPYNRLTALVAYYQTKYKVTHGNSQDQIHANHLLDVDVFFTADKTFHKVLVDIVNNHYRERTVPILINRGASSALEEISAALINFT